MVKTRGFTLIEIAIVIVIIGLLVSGGITIIRPVVEGQKTEEAAAKLAFIEKALTTYVMRYSCLPCPAATGGDGTAQFTGPTPTCGTGCTSDRGVVPWVTLGIARDEALDPWGMRVRYEVTSALVATGSMVRSGSNYGTLGTIDINDAAGGVITTEAAYVLVSHGPNRAFAFGNDAASTQTPGDNTHALEVENQDADDDYVQDTARSINNANFLDDIVLWRSKPIIIQLCGNDACGNPA